MNKEISKLLSHVNENKFSHAYLIETNDQNRCYDELLLVIKKLLCLDNHDLQADCNFCKSIENGSSLNFFIVKPDGKNIKKEQILNLKRQCQMMPVLAKNNAYLIFNAEKLNASSANTMLKFIEEPNENLFGIFLTNNKENVINTIKSRCEIISLKYTKSSQLNLLNISQDEYNDILTIVENYITKIEIERINGILYNKTELPEDIKEKMDVFFSIVLMIYKNIVDNYYNNVDTDIIKRFNFLKNFEIENLLKKIEIIVSLINNLGYNLNNELLLDKFVIEMGEING